MPSWRGSRSATGHNIALVARTIVPPRFADDEELYTRRASSMS
jgi:hypothetical protein